MYTAAQLHTAGDDVDGRGNLSLTADDQPLRIRPDRDVLMSDWRSTHEDGVADRC